MTYDWREPNCLLTLQIGDTANNQMVFPVYSALGGDCDKLITNLLKGNKFEVEVKCLTESSKGKMAEALASFISVDTSELCLQWVSWSGTKKCTKSSYSNSTSR